MLDPRIVKIGIEINGQIRYYEGLAVTASGTKYANPIQNECEIKITNLAKETRDFILTESSPLNANRTRKQVYVEAGRESYGTAILFQGDIVSVTGGQPPDITITIKAQTGAWEKGNIVAVGQPGQAKLSAIAGQVAGSMGLTLDFQAKDKNVSNHNFTGAALKQVDKLGTAGAVNAYVDDGRLVVKDYNIPLSGRVRVLDMDSGMIGVPEFTEQGIKVKFLLDNQSVLGGGLRIKSKTNPAADGDYVIYKLGFEVASRDTPFYYIAEAVRGK
jgi:hypothetical protein